MRAWMKGRKYPFTPRMIYDGLRATDRDTRMKIGNSLSDFPGRGEIYEFITPLAKQKRRQNIKKYKYNHAWRRAPKGKDRARILKAAYVSAMEFAASDIERLSGAGRSHVEKTIKSLLITGDIIVVGRRTCSAGVGAEQLYNIADRIRYRVEVMG